jgi:inner membrane transporter RhtA
VPFALEMLALRRLTTAAFGTLMSLEPAIALVLGLVLLDQVPGAWSLAGIAFVVAAGIGAERTGARHGLVDVVTYPERQPTACPWHKATVQCPAATTSFTRTCAAGPGGPGCCAGRRSPGGADFFAETRRW